jgi:endogenous inhibitor of DNA gyrase (YacG/DUF329 family)
MIRGKCPLCAKPYEIKDLGALPSFPFCSERCKLVDLGRWIDGAYAIPGPSKPEAATDQEDEVEEDAEE